MVNVFVTYIGKMVKGAVVSAAAVAFVAGSILCCCLTMPSRVQTHAPKSVAHCHASKAGHAADQESQTCNCCKITRNKSDQTEKFAAIVPSLGLFIQFTLVADHWFHLAQHIFISPLAYQGPPGDRSSPALYLQYSVLRL